MELRRALLLFAIVLGLAAVVTSVSRPPERERSGEPRSPAQSRGSAPTASPQPGGDEPVGIRFDSEGLPRRALVGTDRPATITVSVDAPGQVQVDGLGLSSAAEPLTPARFDLLPSDAGRHLVRFTPAGTREARTVGVLQIEPAG